VIRFDGRPVARLLGAVFGLCLFAEPSSGQIFTKITKGPIVTHNQQSTGAAWVDYDLDGDLDLLVTNLEEQVNRLYQNQGDGTFIRVTDMGIVVDGGNSYAATWADYDNDGDPDAFVANGGAQDNFLYDNNGDGTFTTISAGILVNDDGNSLGCAWADYDRDGDVDLFVANHGGNNGLYRNDGGGAFTKDTTSAVVTDGEDSVMGAWADYDGDNDLDLFVPNGFFAQGHNSLYENNGDGTFTKVTAGPVVTDSLTSVGGSWGDYDNDGDLDLFVTNAGASENNSLYRNEGSGSFVAITTGDIVNDGGLSVGSGWGDYDNDGDLDLFVANAINQSNFLYENNHDGTFTKVTSGDVVTEPGHSFGCAWGDYDNNGFLDLVVTNGGVHSRQTNLRYRNNGNANNWIHIECLGFLSNRSAIGTKVRVKTTEWQMREVTSQTGCFSQNSLIVEFGLGSASVDSLVIEWPSGCVQTFEDFPQINQLVQVAEPLLHCLPVGIDERVDLPPGGVRLAQNYPNPFRPATRIPYSLSRSTRVTLGIYTVQGREVVRLLDGRQPSGQHSVVWNGTDARGNAVSSGIYLYRLVAKDETSEVTVTDSKRLVLLR
jgi:hypothetical protein